MQDTAGGGREIDFNFPESPQSKKASVFPTSRPGDTLENGSKGGMLSLDAESRTACEVAAPAGLEMPWLHATAVNTTGGAGNTHTPTLCLALFPTPAEGSVFIILGNGKDFKWTKHFIFV